MTQPDSISKRIKVELKTELPYWLIILPCIFLFGLITRPNFISHWPLMLGVTVALLSFSAFFYRLNSIEINPTNGEVSLTETNLLNGRRAKHYPFRNLQFTYKVGKVNFRSRVVNICILYIENKRIAKVIPGNDGWTEESVNELAKTLTNAGVNKKFIGYSFKDAEINGL